MLHELIRAVTGSDYCPCFVAWLPFAVGRPYNLVQVSGRRRVAVCQYGRRARTSLQSRTNGN